MIIGRSISKAIQDHNDLSTGVHGVSTLYVARSSRSDQLIANAVVASNAAIIRTKLNFGDGLVMADLATAIKNAANGLPVLDASADVPLAQIPDTLTGKDADTLDGLEAAEMITLLTVEGFQANAGTGTATNPQSINNNNVSSIMVGDAEGEYSEVAFGLPVLIKQWRHYGYAAHEGDGRWKFSYFDGVWHDWETNIPVSTVAGWSAFASPAAGVVSCTIFRVTCTTVDTGGYDSRMPEMEVKY